MESVNISMESVNSDSRSARPENKLWIPPDPLPPLPSRDESDGPAVEGEITLEMAVRVSCYIARDHVVIEYTIIGASVSEPHTSDVNVLLVAYMVFHAVGLGLH